MTKRLIGVFVVAAAVVAFGVTPVHASPTLGPFCLTFPGFCDQVQISTEPATGNTVGLWDWTCDGVNISDAIGRIEGKTLGTQPDANGVPAGFSALFVFHVPGSTIDLWGTFDGLSTTPFVLGTPFQATAGACDFSQIQTRSGNRLTGSR